MCGAGTESKLLALLAFPAEVTRSESICSLVSRAVLSPFSSTAAAFFSTPIGRGNGSLWRLCRFLSLS